MKALPAFSFVPSGMLRSFTKVIWRQGLGVGVGGIGVALGGIAVGGIAVGGTAVLAGTVTAAVGTAAVGGWLILVGLGAIVPD